MDFRSSSYNKGGYSLSSSNLSPLAPPFSVDRSNFDSNLGPYMDYTEPPYAPHNREPTCPPAFGHDLFRSPVTELESMPFSKGYGYSSLKGLDSPSTHLNYNSATSADTILYSQCLDSMRTSAVGATPYYPSYISPAIHNDSPTVPYNPASYDWTSTFQFATSDGSSHGEYAKNTLDSKPTAQWGGSWSGLAEWNQGKIKPVEPVGSFNSKTKNVADLSIDDNLANQGFHDFKASNSGDDSLISINLLGLGNQNVPVSTGQSADKSFLGKNSESMRFDFSRTSSIGPLSGTVPDAPLLVSSGNCQFAYGGSYDKHLRQHDTQSLVSTASSVPMTGLFKDFNVGSDMADTDLRANNSGNVNEPHLIPSSESTVCFNPTQLSLHLERKDHALLTNNTDLSNRSASNALDHIFRAKAGLQIPHRSPDALSLALNNTNEVLDSAEKSIESIDRYNPPVDSPCWKGAPTSRFSQFEAFSAPGPQYMKKSEEHFGWNLQEPQNFLFSMDDTMNFTENSGKNTTFHEINCFENGLAASLRMSSVTNLASEESKSNGAIKGKFFHSNPSCINEVSHPDGISEAGKNFVLPDKPTPLKTVQQSVKRDEMTYDKKHSSGCSSIDVGSTMNESLENGLSHATEDTESSLPSLEDVPGKLRKLCGEESIPNIDVQMLVNTMHNLSELLLLHRMNSTCELKEQDHHALKNVINNLDKCIFKDVDQRAMALESFLHPQPNSSQFVGELHELHQNESLDRSNLTKVAPAPVPVQVQEAKDHSFAFSKHHDKVADSSSATIDAEMVKEESMIMAIKRVLSENFYDENATDPQTLLYRNLWLEAEAALCSVNYRSRFNRMKNEIEKCSSKIGDTVENTVDGEKLSRPEVLPDLTTVGRSARKARYVKSPDTSVQDSPISNTSNSTNDVMARFHILRGRINNSVAVDELSSSNVHPGVHEVSKLVPEEQDCLNMHNVIEAPPVSGTKNKAEDFEASVMARFHVLKSRIDNSSSVCSEGQLLDVVGFAGNKIDYPTIRNRTDDESLNIEMDYMMMHNRSYSTEKEQGTQSCDTYRISYQLPTYDSSSSDWEHVMKEDFAGQNN